MSYGHSWPPGYVTNMKWEFEGHIPDGIWRSFRTKFSKEHAPGWTVKKHTAEWGNGHHMVNVTFRTTNPDTAREMTADQWDFLKATLGLLVVKNP